MRNPFTSLSSRLRSRRSVLVVAFLVAAAAATAYWALRALRRVDPGATAPMLVVGIDGAEWRVVHYMWRHGELPNLKRLADQGSSASLRTAYNASPVIWTTIATGVTPAEHGITDFVVPSPHGDVPVNSTVRRVPALWTMLTMAHRRVSVFGWWGSWPAEAIDGVVVSDRALFDLDDRVSPASYLPKLAEDVAWARTRPYFAASEEPELRDAVMAAAARRMVRDDPNLLLLYFRSTDIVSHHHWMDFEAIERGAGGPHTDSPVQRIYRAVDAALGEVLNAARGPLNVLVISDHGFRAARRQETLTLSNLDALLVRLGYQRRDASGVDLAHSQLYSYASPTYQRRKLVRCSLAGREPGGTLTDSQCDAVRARFEADLGRVTFAGGEPVFLVRDARPREERAGADFVALLSSVGTSTDVRIGKQRVADVVTEVGELSGTHDSSNNGILIAAGPNLAAGVNLDGISVLDMAPTILYGRGLPVGENFAGRAWTELYTREFRQRNPPRTIQAWAQPRQTEVRGSKADEKVIQELRSLGYLR